MKHSFKAKIFKVGINPCVKVPFRITNMLFATKGYIPVKGTINDYNFQQTLCPVKDDKYRLYVNGPMLKGGNVKLGDTAAFIIEQDTLERNKSIPMSPEFKSALKKNDLLRSFQELSPSRQKEVNRYLNNLKTPGSLKKNIDKVISAMLGKGKSILIR
jgi:hypothetical protein